MSPQLTARLEEVNCRVGSLEIDDTMYFLGAIVNCRVGSLEMLTQSGGFCRVVNCRVGSLEMQH